MPGKKMSDSMKTWIGLSEKYFEGKSRNLYDAIQVVSPELNPNSIAPFVSCAFRYRKIRDKSLQRIVRAVLYLCGSDLETARMLIYALPPFFNRDPDHESAGFEELIQAQSALGHTQEKPVTGGLSEQIATRAEEAPAEQSGTLPTQAVSSPEPTGIDQRVPAAFFRVLTTHGAVRALHNVLRACDVNGITMEEGMIDDLVYAILQARFPSNDSPVVA